MKIYKAAVPMFLITVSIAVAVLMGSSKSDALKKPILEKKIIVDVAEVIKQDTQISINSQGIIIPHRETSIVAEVSGRVVEVYPNFFVGGYVYEGELLLRIDDTEYRANVTRAKAEVAKYESELAQEQGRVDVATRELSKIAKKPRTKRARELYLRQPQMKQAKARLLSAQADLRTAQYDLERTVVRAPYEGIIKEKHRDLGSYLSPNIAIADVFAVDFVEVRLPLPNNRLPYIQLPLLRSKMKSWP